MFVWRATYLECTIHCLEHLGRIIISEANSSNIAVLIADPVQSEGGFILRQGSFLRGVVEICRKKNIVFATNEEERG